VSVNGIVKPALTNLAMATNSAGPEDFIFSASISDIIAITKTAAGSWPTNCPTKMRVELFDGT
tara:strand:+ start:1225 stop:1413 length:189 start_codon:yes stop_codon:yes gene_type:complete